MSTQKSLIGKCKIENVLKPKTNSQWQLFRGEEVAGSGTYHAMNNEGVVENVGLISSSIPILLDNITASPLGTQADATLLTAKYNRVTSSVLNGSVKVLEAKIGNRQFIYNDTLVNIQIFPFEGNNATGIINTSYTIIPQESIVFESAYSKQLFIY